MIQNKYRNWIQNQEANVFNHSIACLLLLQERYRKPRLYINIIN